jgi:solute carrier family 35 protein E1
VDTPTQTPIDESEPPETSNGKPNPAFVTRETPFVRRKIPFSEVRLSKNGTTFTVSKFAQSIDAIRENLFLVGLLTTWYGSNIFYNIYNKQVLSVFPYASTCTFVHLLTACVLMAFMWLLRLKKLPQINKQVVEQVLPVSALHLVGFVATNMSLGAVNVSLTHTIKSLEPFFTVVLSYLFLGTVPSFIVTLTLIPIVAGVVIASATDLSFGWFGFITAMVSNVAFQSRNVISKKLMVSSSLDSLEDGSQNQSEPLDEINLFACMTISATILMVPFVLAIDGFSLYERFNALGTGLVSTDVVTKTVLAGICRTGDVISSYALLSKINPVTHSVTNCVKVRCSSVTVLPYWCGRRAQAIFGELRLASENCHAGFATSPSRTRSLTLTRNRILQ